MNSSSTTAIYMALSGLIFIIGLTYALSSITANQEHFENSPGTEGTVFYERTEIPKEILFTGYEVVSSIYKLNFDEGFTVQVDSLSFSTPKDIKDKLALIPTQLEYSQSISYAADGSISTILYVSQ